MTEDKPHWIRFGIYELNIEERIILRKGVRLRLQDKPLRAPCSPASKPGQLVDRDELRRKLWPTGTNVDFEHGIRVAMHKLRTALDETAESPRFIETVPGHGYRFIAPMTQYQSKTQIDCPVVVVLPIIGLARAREIRPHRRWLYRRADRTAQQCKAETIVRNRTNYRDVLQGRLQKRRHDRQ